VASLFHHRRVNLAVALGVCAATAVLTGALLVGDSMRGSLRDLALDRLGRIEYALVAPRLFRAELAAEVQSKVAADVRVVPAIVLRGTLENPDPRRRVNRVTVLGTDDPFGRLDSRSPDNSAPLPTPGDDEVVINETAGDELGVAIGGEIILRLPKPSNVPADSPLGRKTETVATRRLKVAAIVPARGIGRFDLQPSQQESANAFASPATLGAMLNQPGRVNALFLAHNADTGAHRAPYDTGAHRAPYDTGAHRAPYDKTLGESLRPTLADYGLIVKRVQKTHDGKSVIDYFDVTSDQMVIPPVLEQTILAAIEPHRPQAALTYLANSIIAADDKPTSHIPYSTVTAIDANESLGPFTSDVDGKAVGRLADDEIVITSWVRDDLAAHEVTIKPGDPIKLTFFEPESTHGRVAERSHTFRLRAIVPLAKPGEPPLLTNDPDLTPTVPGVTDQASIRRWNAPFPYDERRIRGSDDDYWKAHRTTPKAYVSLAAGRKLWGSRFGQTTSIRAPAAEGLSVESISDILRAKIDPADAGFVFRPVRREALAASAGTTPFEGLFLGFSMFIIAAALMMLALLFRLGIEQRASEAGLMLAVGVSRRTTALMLAAEGAIVAGLGAAVGVAAGIGYGALMLAGLQTWWIDAIRTPFLSLHITPGSLALGYAAGVLVSVVTILWTLWRMRGQSVRGLLSGRSEEGSVVGGQGSGGRRTAVLVGIVAAAVGLGLYARQLSGAAQAGAFFGAGALVLAAALVMVGSILRTGGAGSLATGGTAPLVTLAVRNAARNPGRSTLTIGLVAAATFLIVAISAFRQNPTDDGAGGFALLAEADQTVFHDPADAYGREQLGFSDEQAAALGDTTIVPLRVRAGDDASCLNLYQPRQPRVIGIPIDRLDENAFAWSSRIRPSANDQAASPWWILSRRPPVLEQLLPGEESIPVVLDEATATYSLKLGLRDKFDLDDGRGGTIHCQIVGLLKNNIFQGSVLMADEAFRGAFPDESGFRMFLVRTPAGKADAVAATLEDVLGDYGLDVQRTDDVLRSLLAVQNTYLSTFQSLGALGLLLGTFGLAAVQLRNVFERRGELALLRAAGFSRRRLGRIVLYENAVLLVVGLGVGVAAALVAVLPHLGAGGAAVPWVGLAVMLGLILVAGIVAGLVAVRSMLSVPVVAALRGD
jgi:ABC-type antimicrobial peptide transport system permease subunit